MAVYHYQPEFGPLPGDEFERQTERFLADAASRAEWGNVAGRPDMDGFMEDTREQMTDLEQRTAAVEEGVSTARTGVAANAAAIAVLTGDGVRSRADINRLTERADGFDVTVSSLANRAGGLETDMESAQANIEVLTERADGQDVAVSGLAHRADGLQADMASTRTALEVLTGRADATDGSLANAHAEAAQAAAAAVDARHAADAVRDKLDALAPDDIGAAPAARGVPPGLLSLWDGAEPPAGWLVCNGQNGTPDLSGYASGSLHYIRFAG